MSMGSELAPNDYLNLPLGARFRPKKKERINGFLKLKNMGIFRFPIDGPIPTIDLYDCKPEDLPYKKDFFSWRDRLQGKEEQYKRQTKTGFWKSTCGDKKIIEEDSGQCIGKKKTLVFHTKPKKRTDWTMYEYSQLGSLPNQSGDYAIYFLKKKKTKKGNVDTPESSEGHDEIHGQAVPDENGHLCQSRSQSPDMSFPHGGEDPQAPSGIQASDDQTILGLQSQPIYSPGHNYWPQVSIGEESQLQYENLFSYNYGNHQIAWPHSPLHQHLGVLPGSS